MDEDALLQQALAMSMTADEPPASDGADGGANGSAPHAEQVRRKRLCASSAGCTSCVICIGTGRGGQCCYPTSHVSQCRACWRRHGHWLYTLNQAGNMNP